MRLLKKKEKQSKLKQRYIYSNIYFLAISLEDIRFLSRLCKEKVVSF